MYRGKHCMKNFCESLREYAMKIIDFKHKKKLLTKENEESKIFVIKIIKSICKR